VRRGIGTALAIPPETGRSRGGRAATADTAATPLAARTVRSMSGQPLRDDTAGRGHSGRRREQDEPGKSPGRPGQQHRHEHAPQFSAMNTQFSGPAALGSAHPRHYREHPSCKPPPAAHDDIAAPVTSPAHNPKHPNRSSSKNDISTERHARVMRPDDPGVRFGETRKRSG